MPLRKPLVVNAGKIQQLQPGDTLDAPQSGGDDTVLTNANAAAVVVCAPVYVSANDSFDKAQANAPATTDVFGLVSQSPSVAAGATGPVRSGGVLAATTAQWDAVAGTTGGMARGTYYYLDPATAGKLTATAPSTAGQFVVEVGLALSTTELLIRPRPPILL
jgi:hypothetical protein